MQNILHIKLLSTAIFKKYTAYGIFIVNNMIITTVLCLKNIYCIVLILNIHTLLYNSEFQFDIMYYYYFVFRNRFTHS